MSKIEICNRGLSTYLGQAIIVSFDEDTPAAEQCNLHYDSVRETILESHWWKFASGREVLAELENDRPNEWNFKYQRPAAALAIRWVNDPLMATMAISRGEDPDSRRETFADVIYSNVQYAVCEFTKSIEDTTLMPMHFQNAVSAEVAARSAMTLVEDFKRARLAMDSASTVLFDAIAFDESQAPPKQTSSIPEYLKQRGL